MNKPQRIGLGCLLTVIISMLFVVVRNSVDPLVLAVWSGLLVAGIVLLVKD